MWLWTCCPFKELGGRQRTASRRGSVKRVWILVGVVTTPTDRQCVHRRRSVPFPCSLSCEGFDSWAYAHCQMVTVLSSSQSPTVFCRCVLWRVAEVGSLTWLVFRQSVDLLITSPTRAPTICLPVPWVHIGRSTYPSQKKNWDSHAKQNDTERDSHAKQNYRRVHARESTRLCPSGVRLSQFFWPR